MKIFATDPRVGFLSHARWVQARLASGELPGGVADAAGAARLVFNDRLNAVVAGFFLLAVVVILVDSILEWRAVLSGRKPTTTNEAPYVARAVV
jgi:carbon starvation protein